MTRNLPVLNGREAESSLHTDGTRQRIVPADVHGRFARARRVVMALLVAWWALLPWIRIGGAPALFLDIEHRTFFLFGASFNAQDIWLLFFLLTGVAFGLLFATALLGRVWCGWACPQTVFLEALFRPIERLVNGSREARQRRERHGDHGPGRLLRPLATHALYLVASAFVAHVVVAYFVSLPSLGAMVARSPAAHPEVFAWMLVVTGLVYGNFAFFREQMCVVLCPYGRLQSVLLDEDSLVVGYDERRGEPRGKKGKTSGDCVDCRRCVVVCPTGIDIRNGLQMDCIACTACVDACDDVMDKLGRPRGLVRYDSPNGLDGVKRRVLRPRVLLYSVLMLVGATVAFFAVRSRTSFEANLVRLPGAPFVQDGETVRNGFEIHLVNKSKRAETFFLEPESADGQHFTLSTPRIEVEGLGSRRIPVFVTSDGRLRGKPTVRLRVRRENGDSHDVQGVFLGGPS